MNKESSESGIGTKKNLWKLIVITEAIFYKFLIRQRTLPIFIKTLDGGGSHNVNSSGLWDFFSNLKLIIIFGNVYWTDMYKNPL